MGGKPEDRLRWKEPLHSLGVELERDYGLSAIASRALVKRISEYLETYVSGQPETRDHWQINYPAVAVGELSTGSSSPDARRSCSVTSP